MRRLMIAMLALPLMAAAAPRGDVGLGVGASSSTDVVVKINGKNTTVKLAGVNNGTYAGQAFLQCLVERRIVRVDRAAGRVTMLDGTSVADHLAEFLQTRTQSDPCALGKAAYAPAAPPLASSVVVASPTEAGAAATKSGKPKREGHVSFGSTGAKMNPDAVKVSPVTTPAGQPQVAGQPPPAKPATDQPTVYRPPTVGTVQVPTGSTYTPPTSGTTTPPQGGTVQVQPGQTYTPPQAGTTTIPSTSTNPP